ncbi:hypothetical protein AGMMS49545_07760 [Betaproteobacteria bacterium]|nr:hypothetical protein AGMMS49545_07760 [Betaproteobacteria bacterium]GHU42734.1 hypothetical protein AGMMS50289_07940 [Betaproteobacteria bacterium]
MKTDFFSRFFSLVAVRLKTCLLVASVGLLAAGCVTTPDSPATANRNDNNTRRAVAVNLDRSSATPEALLAYYQALSAMPANDLVRERRLLDQLGLAPDTQLRQAMVLGHPRLPSPELTRANGMLENLLKSDPTDAKVNDLRPIIRLLADSYAERLRQENTLRRQNAQIEKQHQRLLESQRQASETKRQASELQTQLEGLANIERSLPRTRTVRSANKL